MKVDWKYFAQTTGYKSLKASVNHDKMRHPNDKARYEQFFRRIINKVCHCAQVAGVQPWVILTTLEEQRTYWYPNFYNNSVYSQFTDKPLCKKRLHPTTQRGAIRAYKHGKGLWTRRWHDRRKQKAALMDIKRRFK